MKKTVGDIEDYVEHPGKLLDKVFQAFGVNMNAFGIPKLASLPHDMMAAMFKKLKMPQFPSLVTLSMTLAVEKVPIRLQVIKLPLGARLVAFRTRWH